MADSFKDKMKRRLLSGEFADFHILCSGRKIPVHRAIICQGSPILQKACDGTLLGSPSDRVDVADTDLETISKVLLFLYTGDYDDYTAPIFGMTNSSPSSQSTFSKITCKYDADSLTQGQTRMTTRLTSDGNTQRKRGPTTMLQHTKRLIAHAKVHMCAKNLQISALVTLAEGTFFTQAVHSFCLADFAPAAQYVFRKTPMGTLGLRSQVVRVCFKYMTLVNANSDLTKMLEKHEGVAWTLLRERKALNEEITKD